MRPGRAGRGVAREGGFGGGRSGGVFFSSRRRHTRDGRDWSSDVCSSDLPDPRYPFLGVHLTPRFDGEVLVGPNAVLALAREGYRWRDVSPAELAAIARFPGFRRFARQHWRTGLAEMRGSLSKKAYTAAARRYVPELTADDMVPAAAGIRAQALESDGSLVDDFRITRRGAVVAVRNAP